MIDTLATRYIQELDKWHDYLAMKAQQNGHAAHARPNILERRVVARGAGLSATLSKFIGRGAAGDPKGMKALFIVISLISE